MTLSIERAAVVAIIGTVFELDDYETTVIEAITQKRIAQVDKNNMIDKSKQYLESVICGAILYLRPETNIDKILTLMCVLHDSEKDISARMVMVQRMQKDLPGLVGAISQLKLEPSLAVDIRNLLVKGV